MEAIVAAHAFDGVRFLRGGATVLVDGERIVGVEEGRADLPDGTDVRTYPGTILPGLFDCHTHLVADGSVGALERAAELSPEAIDDVVVESLRRQAAAGVTTVRDLGDRDFRTLAFGGVPGLPRLIAAGPPLTTPGGHCHFLGGAVAGGLGDAVVRHVDRGVDVIKVMASGGFLTPGTDQAGAQFSSAEIAEAVDEAHRAGRRIVAHAHSLLGIENAVAAGVDGVEHFTGLTSQGARLDDRLLDEVARRGIAVDLTLGLDREVLAAMPEPPPHFVALLAKVGVNSLEEFDETRLTLLRRLREHGVRVICGVDSGIAPPKQHGNAWRVVGEFVEGGYPVAEALAAATSVAADACGVGGDTGRLAAGYAADLLVVHGDLALDVSRLSAPLEVLLRGTPATLR